MPCRRAVVQSELLPLHGNRLLTIEKSAADPSPLKVSVTEVGTEPGVEAGAALNAALTPSGSTRTVERALALLGEVCLEGAMTLSECARRTGLAPSTALRLLRTLELAGFVSRAADGTFRPGVRTVQLGALALGRQSLVAQVQPSLQRIVEQTGESAYFVISGPSNTAVYLALVEGTHAIRHTSWVGRAIDLEELAVGRALRGDVPQSGYVAQRDRLEPDVTAIAAPIRWSGGVAGALNLLGPTYRIDEAAMHTYGAIVAAEAAAISAELGTSSPPPRGTRALQEAQ
jgi:IclR family acetate operon transcriptional repressor